MKEKLIKYKYKDFSNDTFLDPIISIENVENNKYVYDFTVADTRNFSGYNLILHRDSFHVCGIDVV